MVLHCLTRAFLSSDGIDQLGIVETCNELYNEASLPTETCSHWISWGLQLLLRMHTTFYSAGSIVASAGEAADRLMIIVSGRVKVRVSLSKQLPLQLANNSSYQNLLFLLPYLNYSLPFSCFKVT